MSVAMAGFSHLCVSESQVVLLLQGPNESDTEDLLQLLINPNDVYSSRSPSASPESNRGISDQPLADAPLPNESRPPDLSPAMIYEALGDTASMEAGALAADACSSQLSKYGVKLCEGMKPSYGLVQGRAVSHLALNSIPLRSHGDSPAAGPTPWAAVCNWLHPLDHHLGTGSILQVATQWVALGR